MSDNSKEDLQLILESVFDAQSDIYPLSIIPTKATAYGIKTDSRDYSCVYFASPSLLLSLDSEAAQLEEHYSLNKDSITLECLELGNWCREILRGEPWDFEFCDLPFLYRDEQFKVFEQLAMGVINQKLIKSYLILSDITPAPALYAFNGYFRILQGIYTAREGKLIHEAKSLIELADKNNAPSYKDIIQKLEEDNTVLSYTEIGRVREEQEQLRDVLQKALEDTSLPESYNDEQYEKLNAELLRFRRSFL